MFCINHKIQGIMSTPNPSLSVFLLLLSAVFLSSVTSTLSDTGSIGINYGRVANDLPDPTKVVQLLQKNGLTKVKLYDTDSTVLSALAGSGIAVTVALPNENLSIAASNPSFADSWVQSNILTYYPKTQIEAIAVGNEVFVDPKNTKNFLVPAMKNVYASLVKYNLSTIKISSPVALSALQSSYPSSAGAFKQELIEPVIKPMMSFLKQTNSYLMVNAYPFFAYIANTDTIPLDYVLFNGKGVTDPNNGLVYHSLLEAQLDAVYAAMDALSFNDVKMVVSETGWPSKGDENEVGANQQNAASYNGNLVRRVLTGNGTPLRPNEPLNVYLFALFNEDAKPGPTSERNYGLFYPSEEKVYDIPLTAEELVAPASSPPSGKNQVVTNSSSGGGDFGSSAVGQTWCVANGEVAPEKLQEALDYACGEGKADCRPIQEGSTCYDPNSLEAHASYAFNSYYQMNSRKSGSCYFGGAAYVVSQPPNYGDCKFPTGY